MASLVCRNSRALIAPSRISEIKTRRQKNNRVKGYEMWKDLLLTTGLDDVPPRNVVGCRHSRWHLLLF